MRLSNMLLKKMRVNARQGIWEQMRRLHQNPLFHNKASASPRKWRGAQVG